MTNNASFQMIELILPKITELTQQILDFHCDNIEIIENIIKHTCQTQNWKKAYEILCHIEGWVYDTTSIKKIENKLNHIVEKYQPNIAYTIPWQIYPYNQLSTARSSAKKNRKQKLQNNY